MRLAPLALLFASFVSVSTVYGQEAPLASSPSPVTAPPEPSIRLAADASGRDVSQNESGDVAQIEALASEPEELPPVALNRGMRRVEFYEPALELPNAFGNGQYGAPITIFFDPRFGASRSEDDLLPPASDPNDFQTDSLHNTKSLGTAHDPIVLRLFRGSDVTSETDPKVRYGLQARPGIFYDTGYVSGETFNPANIALDGEDEAHLRGQINFKDLSSSLENVPIRFQQDVQLTRFFGIDNGQAYFDLINSNGNDFQFRNAFIRVASSDELLVGKAESVFGDLGSSPKTLATGALPVGAVGVVKSTGAFQGIGQLRYTVNWNTRTESSISIEDQSALNDDVINEGTGVTVLRRPAFAGRIRYHGTNGFDSYQLAALFRPFAIDDPAFQDHTADGWGLSGIARRCNSADNLAVYAGVVGGQGIGNYIYGGTRAAYIPNETEIVALTNYGCYVAAQCVWLGTFSDNRLSSNVAYGCSAGKTARDEDNRSLHQAWCNLLWNATGSSAYGLEYQYGYREIGDGNSGDDHRFMFVAQVGTGAKNKDDARSRYPGRNRAASSFAQPGPRTLSSRRL